MEKVRSVLFVCIHNSARSQMAEAFLNHHGKGRYVAESAGIEKGRLNPLVVTAMLEKGIDISNNQAKEVSVFLDEGRRFDAVVTVCDAASAEKCPVFPGRAKRLAWSFADPSVFKGTDEEKLGLIREVRDAIEDKIREFVGEDNEAEFWK
jgi:arsenate reductase (thioredoxin)